MNHLVQIVVGGLLQGSVFAVVALGQSLVYRATGIINLSQGAFCVLAALLYERLSEGLGWPAIVACLAAAAVTTLAGTALGAATFVPGLSRLADSSMLMLTAGLLVLLEGLMLVAWGSQPYAVAPFSGEPPITVLGIRVPSQGPWIGGVSLLVFITVWYFVNRTDSGRALLACGENPYAARLLGVDVQRMALVTFGVAALIAALGGITLAPVVALDFSTGRFFTTAGFIAVAIGGMNSLAGAIGGGLFLGVAEQLAAGYVSSLFSNALALGLLLLVLLWRPDGLFPSRSSRRRDVRDDPRVPRTVVRLRGPRALLTAAGTVAVLAVLAALFVFPRRSPAATARYAEEPVESTSGRRSRTLRSSRARSRERSCMRWRSR